MPEDPTTTTSVDETVGVRRGWGTTALVGLLAAIAAAATIYILVAMPLYFLASLEPNGRDRPIVRSGLLVIGPLLAAAAGLVAAPIAGYWCRSGRGWGTDDHEPPVAH